MEGVADLDAVMAEMDGPAAAEAMDKLTGVVPESPRTPSSGSFHKDFARSPPEYAEAALHDEVLLMPVLLPLWSATPIRTRTAYGR